MKEIFNHILLELKFISADLTNILIVSKILSAHNFRNFKGCFSIPFCKTRDHTLVLWFGLHGFVLSLWGRAPQGGGGKHGQCVCCTPFTFLLLGWVSYPLLNSTLSVGCHRLSGDSSSSFVRPQTPAFLGTPAKRWTSQSPAGLQACRLSWLCLSTPEASCRPPSWHCDLKLNQSHFSLLDHKSLALFSCIGSGLAPNDAPTKFLLWGPECSWL